MKKLILITMALLSLSATATSLQTRLGSRILRHDFDNASPLAAMQIIQSDIVIDFRNDFISLNFILPWNCPPNALCSLVAPMRTFKIDYLTFETSECNIVTYQAEKDDRPVDGSYEKITVRDFSRNTCPHIMVYPYIETSIEFEQKYIDRMQGEEIHFKHHFTAGKLN